MIKEGHDHFSASDNPAMDFAAERQAHSAYDKIYSLFDLELDKAALLIVDMQKSFCDPESMIMSSFWAMSEKHEGRSDKKWWTERMQGTVIPNCQKLLKASREAGLRIVYMVMGYWSYDGAEFPPHMRDKLRTFESELGLSVHGYQFGTEGTEVIDELAPQMGEVLLQKVTSSAFHSTGINTILKNAGVRYLIIVGQNTDGCVLFNSLDARDFGYRLTLISDACITFDRKKHETLLALYDANWGRVCATEKIIREIRGKSIRQRRE